MPSTLSSPQVSAAIVSTITGGASPAPSTANVNHAAARTPTVGSGAGNVNKIYSAAFTVTNGAPLSLDLTALTDPLGQANNFGTVYSILITNDSTTAGQDFTCFGGTNGLIATSTELCYANGGAKLLDTGTTGITVDGTHKIITIAVAAGTAVPGKITVIGK